MKDTTYDPGLLGDLDNPKGCRRLILIMFINLIILITLLILLL